MAQDVATGSEHTEASALHLQRVAVIRDQQSCVPVTTVLRNTDLLILLTPVIAPSGEGGGTIDPFEPLGRVLAARHPWVRHVPYTITNGITALHAFFVTRAKLVIFIIAGASLAAQKSQIEMAKVIRAVSEHRHLIIVACDDIQRQTKALEDLEFRTIVQASGYSPEILEKVAAILFGEAVSARHGVLAIRDSEIPRRRWDVEALPDSLAMYDISPIIDLWNECLLEKFHLNRFTLQNLLDRDGFGRHYVVKLPQTGEVVGFCATYTTWAFSDPDDLVGSLAALLVKPAYREQGIGTSLYDYAKDLLTRTRGVKRLQLGSTFPRLLAGIPRDLASQDWFRRRGWDIDSQSTGRGREICDWLLRIHDWPSGGFGSIPEGFQFRTCIPDDFPGVLKFLRSEAPRHETMGLFENYKWSRDYLYDIVLCLQGSVIVATALTYTANSGSTADTDLPWARKLGFDVGGITCICISGESSRSIPSRSISPNLFAEQNSILQRHKNSLMIRLLGTCIEKLQNDGMQQIFLDGVRGVDQGFEDLGTSQIVLLISGYYSNSSSGFRKWAVYRDVWQAV